MNLAGRQAELHRQAVGIHDGVNPARKPALAIGPGWQVAMAPDTS
jgi:hypothetical protein